MYDATATENSRYANMTAGQVLDAQAELLARWAQEDAERRQRNAALLAAL